MSDRLLPEPCPYKPGLICNIDKKEICRSKCNGICGRSDKVYNDPRDWAGRSVGYNVEDYAPKKGREI